MADGTSASMEQMVDDLIRGLRKMPLYEGVSFRGGTVEDTFGRSSGTVVAQALTATSRDARVATENFTTPALYAVVGNQGRSIESVSQHPAEREVVFLPGTLFRAVKQVRFDDLLITVVEQLDLDREPGGPKGDLDELLETIATAVRDAQEAEPVEVTTPGKFAGDIA